MAAHVSHTWGIGIEFAGRGERHSFLLHFENRRLRARNLSGKMLWEDQLGEQTGGFNGGYEDIVWARPLQATLWLRVRWFREARRRA